MTSDPDERVALLRTFAVLIQLGALVEWQELDWPSAQHGQYAVTIRVNDVKFWRTYNELHAEQVKREGEAWMRTQGWRRE
jgi:hypothetical protein